MKERPFSAPSGAKDNSPGVQPGERPGFQPGEGRRRRLWPRLRCGTRRRLWPRLPQALKCLATILRPSGTRNLLAGRGVGRRLLAAAIIAVTILALLTLLAHTISLPTRLTEAPSTVVAFAGGSPAYVFLSPDDKYRMAIDPETLALGGGQANAIDPDYLDALLRFEDKRFFRHPGVDPFALARAVVVNLRLGRVATGASTLTMQLVRVLEPRPRNLSSKAIEALRAMQLEIRLSKREILAAYLSFIPFGRNVEGVEAACYAYFGHGPQDLSLDEIAVLLAVPQRPSSRFPASANEENLRAARNEIAGWLLEQGLFQAREPKGTGGNPTEQALASLRTTPVPEEIRPLPRHAPHAAFWLKQKAELAGRSASAHLSSGGLGVAAGLNARIETTLDRGLQLLAERQMRGAHAEMAHRGIHNGAAVIVDHGSAEVRALVGNFDFFDDGHGGQIVGFDTPRSPGSALKPLIYALAIDRGLALPEHLVPDVPIAYGDYAPDNYDGRFTGLISLEDALSHSLNIPFVRLLGRVGVERFIDTLRASGAGSIRPEPGYYGLSAAIGSVEITPLELAALYASLARDGRHRPLSWLAADRETFSRRAGGAQMEQRRGADEIFSRGSAFLTRRALARRDRPDFPSRRRLSGAPPSIHWKTGTSYGHHDAWAAGSGPDHTAVVWLGNFDNSPSVDLVGAEAAGPLLFDLLEAVADRSRPRVATRPSGDLKRVEVCAYSGYLPTRACEQRGWALALRRHVPTRVCPYHAAVDVDRATGLALNPSCRAGRDYQTRNYVVWPASIRRFLSQGHRWLPSPPTLAPECETAGRRTAPAILSPPAGQILVLLPGVAASDQEIPLQAESTSPGARLSWFVDGEFLGTAEAADRLWWLPHPGDHEIVVMDEAGLSARRRLAVRSRS